MKVLVTGGAGYIGAITAAALEASGHTPVILDSLLSGPEAFTSGRLFYRGDIADRDLVARIVADHPDLACTIHMAARIVVTESVALPYEYYRDNVAKSLELFDQLERLGKPRVVFSSSASVYAATDNFEVREDSPTDPQSPYARTKAMVEMVLEDLARAGRLRALILRYFNPIGSDPDLRFGMHVREPTHVLGQLVLGGPGPTRRVRDHRHRLSDPGRHRAAGLHPRLGSRLGPRGCGGAFDTVLDASGESAPVHEPGYRDAE